MSNNIFFNMFRNGDVFIVREFVKEIITQCPEHKWFYAHGNHPDSVKDLPCSYLSMPHFHEVCQSTNCKGHQISEMLPKHKPLLPQEPIRKLSAESNLYINTWTGVYHGYFFPVGHYANMYELMSIWQHITEKLSPILQKKIEISTNPLKYFPKIDASFYDCSNLNAFFREKIDGRFERVILIANGKSLSNQSKLQSLDESVVILSRRFPNYAFIATTKINRNLDNLFYTDDIFKLSFDLPLISILSQKCDVIVGKNSGPYSYANTYENAVNKNKIFVSFSNTARDNLLFNISNGCTFIHDSTDDSNKATDLLRDIIKNI